MHRWDKPQQFFSQAFVQPLDHHTDIHILPSAPIVVVRGQERN